MRRITIMLLVALAGLATLSFAPGASGAPTRQVLYANGSSYPRVIRLAHSGSANGLLLASITTNDGNNGVGVIEASDDNGVSFHQVATIADPDAANGAGICCSSLFELPSPVGALPVGTVLWSDTTGYTSPPARRTSRQRLWASFDHGETWRYLSDIVVASNHYNTWEPSLSVAADGSLVAFYSDETDKTRHDQKLVQIRSTDGLHWIDRRNTVVSSDFFVRPGMATTVRLPNGTYFMTYEVCNNDLVHLCSAYYRSSTDGWDYGDPYDLGTVVRTVDGKYARHTPNVAWSPGPGPAGTILMISEMLVNDDGSVASMNGHVLLANDASGKGPWYEIPSPIYVRGVDNSGCKNFSPAILPSSDGMSVLEVTTDYEDSVCKTFYAKSSLVFPLSGSQS